MACSFINVSTCACRQYVNAIHYCMRSGLYAFGRGYYAQEEGWVLAALLHPTDKRLATRNKVSKLPISCTSW